MKKSIIIFVILALVFCFGITYTKKREQQVKADIERNIYKTVGRLKKSSRRHTNFTYYFEGKKYTGSVENNNLTIDAEGKYFLVELSSKHPDFARIKLNQEITDTAKINNSGFRKKTMTEILDDTTSIISR